MATVISMNRLLAGAALLILMALPACSQMAAGPGQGPFEPYLHDDNVGSHGGGGGEGGGGGGGGM
jgi:hypothetical protein